MREIKNTLNSAANIMYNLWAHQPMDSSDPMKKCMLRFNTISTVNGVFSLKSVCGCWMEDNSNNSKNDDLSIGFNDLLLYSDVTYAATKSGNNPYGSSASILPIKEVIQVSDRERTKTPINTSLTILYNNNGVYNCTQK